MNQPWVYMCSPSWIPLPPHPSGSSQCTSPEHPVSCIEPKFLFFVFFWVNVNEPTQAGVGGWGQAGHQKDWPCDERLPLWSSVTSRSPSSTPCPVIQSITLHNETPIKTLMMLGRTDHTSWFYEWNARKLCMPDLPDLALCVSPPGWSWFTAFQSCLLCHRLTDHRCMGLFLGFYPVPLIHISIFVPGPHCFDDCSFVV